MSLIPPDIIEDVRMQTDIVSLVGEYVRLEKKGRNYTGSCPFHQERDPSFTVSPDKQMFYCFGCQTGGSAIRFLMLIESLTFTESVRRLAGRAGILIPEPDKDRDDKKAAREERVWKINSLAAEFFHDYLLLNPEAAQARDYLAGRGLTPETVAVFKIGYSPAAWDSLVQHMKKQGYKPLEIVEAGLAVENKNRVFDRFRNRIIFPVADTQGRMVAFGGRVLGPAGNQPKYLNTPETPYFNKGRILYGLHLARKAIRQTGRAVIMEGYMDVVTAHQFGVKNAIASMGTSLTPDQGKLLLRYTSDIYISYDADSAGMRAASRGLDILQQIGCRVRVITMPRDTDPDDFIRKNGAPAWQAMVDSSESLLEYKIRLAQGEKKDVSGVLADILPNLAGMQSEIDLEEGVKTVASRLSLSWEAIRGEIRRYKASQGKIWAKPDKIAKNMHNIINSGKPEDALARAELGILKIIAEKPEMLYSIRTRLGDDFIRDQRLSELYSAVARQIESGVFEPARLLDDLDDSSAALLSRVMVEGGDPEWQEGSSGHDRDKIAGDYIDVIKRNQLSRKRMILMQELARAEKNNDISLVNDILKKLQEINS